MLKRACAIARVVVATALATALAPRLTAPPAAEQATQKPAAEKSLAQFAARVDLVMVDVSALDDERRPVRGLTAADFTILDNGIPQTIQAFSAIDLPDVEKVSAPWIRDIAPDVIRNDDLADRRIIAIVLDDALPMSIGYQSDNRIAYVKKAASEVVNQLGPRDLAAVIFPLDKGNGQDFTADRARLLKAIDRYSGNTGFGSADGPGITATRNQYLYTSLLSTVRMLTEYLAEVPDRRKALILATEGIPLDLDAMMPQIALGEGAGTFSWPQLLADLRGTFVAAQRANVNIYPIDPGGLRVSPSNPRVDFLKSLAATTGGYAVVDTNDTAAAVRQIFRENGSYYLLGYAPTNTRIEGRFRKIRVTVKRPGLTVRARTGYLEPQKQKPSSKPAPAPIWKALASPMPRGDVTMYATAAPFALPGRRESAVVIVAGLRQPAPPGTDRVVENAELIVSAYDPKGDRRGSERLTMRVVVRPERQGDVVYEVYSRLDLPPGRYQVRLAASSSMQGKSGSVFVDVDVPNFTKAALSMSGALLSAEAGPAAGPTDKLAGVVPVLPTTRREFDAEERVAAFARLYQGGKQAVAPSSVTSRIVDGQGATVFDRTETFGPDRFGADRAAQYRLDLPMTSLAPGLYLLTIEAKAGRDLARRDVRFTVR